MQNRVEVKQSILAGHGSLSIVWGAWATGMAAAAAATLHRFERLGMGAIPPASGLKALARVSQAVGISPLSEVRNPPPTIIEGCLRLLEEGNKDKNSIGMSGVTIAAKLHNVPFLVVFVLGMFRPSKKSSALLPARLSSTHSSGAACKDRASLFRSCSGSLRKRRLSRLQTPASSLGHFELQVQARSRHWRPFSTSSASCWAVR